MSLKESIALLPEEVINKILLYFGCIDKVNPGLKKAIKVASALHLANFYMIKTFSGFPELNAHNIPPCEIKRMYRILRNCGCCDRHINYFSDRPHIKCWKTFSLKQDKTRYCKWHYNNSFRINRRVFDDDGDCILEYYCNCQCRHITRFMVRHNHISLEEERGNWDIDFNEI